MAGRSLLRVAASIALTVVLLAVSGARRLAHANGRFPESNLVVFSPFDPNLILVRVSFGLLVSRDGGKTFDWVCETSIGFSGIEDPMYAITPSNTWLATTFLGLASTRDQGCGWSFVRGDLAERVFIDLASNPNDDKNVVVFASSYDRQDDAGNVNFINQVWETKDEGLTFSPLGVGPSPQLDPTLLGYTIDLTASDPNRMYISAVRKPGVTGASGVLLVSRDRGATWQEEAVQLEGEERSVFIAAVDPNNADRVYLRTWSGGVEKPSRLIVRDVARSLDDGGALDGGPSSAPTYRVVMTGKGGFQGFALSRDGSKIYVGGPRDGVHVASTSDFVFRQTNARGVQCLVLRDDGGLWACSSEDPNSYLGFVLGVSTDDGATFAPRLHFCEGNGDNAPGIRGPLLCAPGTTTADLCAWPMQKSALGCGRDGPANDGGADGGSSSGGADGCDCHTTPTGTSTANAMLLACGTSALVALLFRSMRARRSLASVRDRERSGRPGRGTSGGRDTR